MGRACCLIRLCSSEGTRLMALVPAFLRWFPGLAPKPPSAPWLVGPDADLLTLGATIGGEDICLSEEWSRNSVVIVGAPGRGRDSVLRSILGSVVAKGGGGIVMRSCPPENGRRPCGDRVCQWVSNSVGGGSLK